MRAAHLCLALSLVAGCRRGASAEPGPPEDEKWIARAVFDRGEAKVVEAKPQLIASPIATGGRIAFDDQRVTHVFSPVSGRVTRVIAQLGQRVQKGSSLLAIASPEVGSAVSDEVKARADLVAAQHEFDRQQRLFDAKAGPRRDLEVAEDNYRKAKAEEERALQRLRLLRAGRVDAVTQEYTLISHIDGRVMARNVNPGIEVQGQFSGGSPTGELFTIGDIDRVWLFADVAESDLPEVRPEAAIKARVLAYPDRLFDGRVEWVSPTLDPALRTARIRCSLSNPEGLLKPEMFASVLIARPALMKLALPREAVERINDHDFVYLAAGARTDGKLVFKRRLVDTPPTTLGPRDRRARLASEVFVPAGGLDAETVPILSGLAEGEKVLVAPAQARLRGPDEASLTDEQFARGKVVTVPVQEREVADVLTVGGRLAFDDLRVTHVFPPVSGRITRLLAAPGQHVKKGSPLAIILSADLGSAFSDELKAKADLIAAEHELKRQREMFEVHATAERDLQIAEDNHNRAKAEYQRATEKTRLLRAGALNSVTQEFVLRSPMEGDVIARNANPGLEVQGQYTAGGSVPELFTVGSIDDLWLLGDVYEADLPFVRVGAEVQLRVSAHPGRNFRGRVDWISDTLDPVLRTAKVRCVLKNEEGLLRPEMYEVVTIAAPARRAVTVPRDALLRLGDEIDVFVEQPRTNDGRVTFRRRAVVANERFPGDEVPVLAGLQPGERVAARGSIFLVGN
ncbi:MAG: efflux RND transporter periplasmic adaptor subunit [Deltaproteobacteria bacterium]|nr:MAG: efflux RND transporter periplasmic adaptor subunit [Deltaproteobacteria bacterium]